MTPPSSAERDARFKVLVDALLSIKPDVFAGFDITRGFYEPAGSRIGADILVPKGVDLTKSRPVIVRIHGGFLGTGSSLFPAWFSKWILDFAEEKGAVIVSPDYRLLPEVRGRDILDDMKAFWGWFHDGGLQRHLASTGRPELSLDAERTLLVGESAGGYLALQSVFLGFTRPRAIITAYPMMDVSSDYYNKSYEKSVVGVPNFPNSIVDSFIRSIPPITEADPPTRLDLALAIVQNGRFREFLGDEPELFTLDRLRNGGLRPGSSGETLLPPMYILHGRHDTAVPVGGTMDFLKLLRTVDPEARVHTVIRDGEHGFDATASVNDGWMREGLDFVAGAWLE